MVKPDFSGTWMFNAKTSSLQIQAPNASTFVVDHREPTLRISRTHFSKDQQDTFSIELTTDGKEVVVRRGNVQLHCRASWEADTLLFDTWLEFADGEATNVVRYSLSPDGRTLTAEERFRSQTLNYDNVWKLDRATSASGSEPARW